MIWATKTILTAQCAFNAHEEPVDKLGVPYIFHLMEVTEKKQQKRKQLSHSCMIFRKPFIQNELTVESSMILIFRQTCIVIGPS